MGATGDDIGWDACLHDRSRRRRVARGKFHQDRSAPSLTGSRVSDTVDQMAAQIASLALRQPPSRAQRVHAGINALETAIDQTLAEGSRLMADMFAAGQDLEVIPQVSQRALEHMQECLRVGLQMRAQAITTHHDLRKIMGKLDLQELGFGDQADCPPDSGG